MKLTPIRFLRSYDKYNAGEVAGFRPDFCAKLIELRVAEPYEPEKPKLAVESKTVEPKAKDQK